MDLKGFPVLGVGRRLGRVVLVVKQACDVGQVALFAGSQNYLSSHMFVIIINNLFTRNVGMLNSEKWANH